MLNLQNMLAIKDLMSGMNNEEKSIDFYEENGIMIMTKEYHLRRGYCCENGCRHCPYTFLENNNEQDNPAATEE